MPETTHEGQITTERDAVRSGKTVVQIWLDKIAAARNEEKDWRTSAQRAADVYEAGKDQKSSFNIYHANVETIIPALYNSTPIPDVRRRYDPEPPELPPQPDPQQLQSMPPEQQQAIQAQMQQAQAVMQQFQAQAKAISNVAEITERGLATSVDLYDFDNVMEDCVRDVAVTGRGVPRIRYVPTIDGDSVDEKAISETVPWDRFIRGPGVSWEVTPFIAFDHDLTRDQVEKIIDDKTRLPEIGFSAPRDEDDGSKDDPKNKNKGILKTIRVYEVWDKSSRQVLFITEQDKNKPLAVEADPLKLTNFFPCPKPLQMVRRLTSQVPVCPYDVYAPLIDEIDRVSKRIAALINQLKVKGGYDPKAAPDFEQLRDADDGTYIPISSSEEFVQGKQGGLEAAVLHWPIEIIIKVLEALYLQREQVKATIYEVMGVSDILRGDVDPREKLGQSQLKAQTGSKRLQRSQNEVARLARDLFRMKAEIMHRRFSPQTLERMTAMRVTPEMQQIIANDINSYAIDIETDSTVRADMAKFQEEISQFTQNTAQMADAATRMAPVMPQAIPPLFKVYSSFARKFNLGKAGEDALEELQEAANQGPVQQDDGAEAAKAEAEARMQEMQAQSEREDRKHQAEMALKDKDRELKELDIQVAREKADIERQKAEFDLYATERKLEFDERKLGLQARMAENDAARDADSKDRDVAHKERMAAIKEKQAAKPKPNGETHP